MTQSSVAPSADRTTLANACFERLVRVVLRRHVAARGGDAGAEAAQAEAVRRLEAALYGLYPEFQRSYLHVFREHVGAEHAAEVLSELQREPLQRYLRARAAMNPEFTQRFEQFKQRMGRIEV